MMRAEIDDVPIIDEANVGGSNISLNQCGTTATVPVATTIITSTSTTTNDRKKSTSSTTHNDETTNGSYVTEDEQLPICFQAKRHQESIEGILCETQSWRIRERMKTVSVALVLCLNIGVDPPDIVKIQPCARLECWIDPSSVSPQKAMELIGANLQKQYERWQPRARYKKFNDPTLDDVKKLCTSLRRNAKEERVLFHYNGHGVPRPTSNGEIWVFNKTYTQYIPLSIYDLQTWMGAPSIYVYDCSNAGIIVNSFNQFAEQHEREMEQNLNGSTSGSLSGVGMAATTKSGTTTIGESINNLGSNITNRLAANGGTTGGTNSQMITFKNCIQLAACSANQILPMNSNLPADLFTSCLTTPIKIALKWYAMQRTAMLVPQVNNDLIEKIPGQLNDRRTMLGELNWIFTAITDTIAWNTLPRDLFQKLFRQDLLVASLFRNFLLAERILRSYDCTPVSSPPLPQGFRHPMWSAWDLAVDLALQQLTDILEKGVPYKQLPFFEEQLTAFQVWLDLGSEKRSPPEQLPIVLQVLLSQVHRLRALELLGRFLDLGPWAVNLALGVGIFPYVLKLLQSSAKELRPVLVFIWAKILAVDSTCQVDLVKDHKYFLSVLQDTTVSKEHRTLSAFVLASIVHNFLLGQTSALQGSLVSICLVQICDESWLLRQWLAICLGHLWQNFAKAKWSGVRDLANEKLYPLLEDSVPEVRAAAVYALGTFISSVTDRSEHANYIDRNTAISLLKVCDDMSPLVRLELVAALQWMVILFENQFVTVYLQDASVSSVIASQNSHTTHSLERNINMKRVFSWSSIPNMNGGNFSTSAIGFGSIYMKLWQGIINLGRDPYPKVAEAARKIIEYVRNQACIMIAAKEATSEKYGSSLSLPPSPNTRTNYLGESPPTSAHHHLHHHAINQAINNGSIVASAVSNVAGVTSSNSSSSKRIQNNNANQQRFIGGSSGGDSTGAHHRSTTPTGQSTNKYRNNITNEQRSKTPPIQNLPNGTRMSAHLTDETESCTTNSGDTNAVGGIGAGVLQQQLQTTKPLVTTKFIPWSISYFARSSRHLNNDINQTQNMDKHSLEYRLRMWRFNRNEYIRRVSIQQQLRAMYHRIDTQNWMGKTQFTPSIVKLLPYEQQIAVAYKEKVSVHDWIRGTVFSYIPSSSMLYNNSYNVPNYGGLSLPSSSGNNNNGNNNRRFGSTASTINTQLATSLSMLTTSSSALSGLLPPLSSSSRVTALEFINAHDIAMILVGYEDGMIRVWQEPALPNGQTRLVTAWQGLSVCNKSTSTKDTNGIVTTWHQRSQQVCVGGNSRSIRIWDAEKELRVCDLLTNTDASVRVLSSSPHELIAAGCSDGSVRLFDKRCSPQDARITTYREHTGAIITACLRDDCQSLVTACAQGKVRLFDVRKHTSFHGWYAGSDVTSIAVHTGADIVACGSQYISIYGLDGQHQTTLRNHEGFMGPKIGHTSCLSFHPHKVILAVGFVDNAVAVYGSSCNNRAI